MPGISPRVKAGLLATVAMLAVACGLDSLQVPQDYIGPSELGISVKITVSPDLLTADGTSTAVVQAEVRGPNGQPLSSRDVYFTINDYLGQPAAIGRLSHDRAATNNSGIAQVTYTAPYRTDATGIQAVWITARPVGNDASGQVYRAARLELRPPEVRLFPQCTANALSATFVRETPNGEFAGVDILFQTTSCGPNPIIRYYWDFGDGDTDDKPDVAHRYHRAGTYTVLHQVTDSSGAVASSTKTFTVQ